MDEANLEVAVGPDCVFDVEIVVGVLFLFDFIVLFRILVALLLILLVLLALFRRLVALSKL